jgi:hypothetical protein
MVYATGFVYLWGWIALEVRRFDERLGLHLPTSTQTGGISLGVAGGLLIIVCLGTFVVRGQGRLWNRAPVRNLLRGTQPRTSVRTSVP